MLLTKQACISHRTCFLLLLLNITTRIWGCENSMTARKEIKTYVMACQCQSAKTMLTPVLKNTKLAILLGVGTPTAPNKGDTLTEGQIQIWIGFARLPLHKSYQWRVATTILQWLLKKSLDTHYSQSSQCYKTLKLPLLHYSHGYYNNGRRHRDV